MRNYYKDYIKPSLPKGVQAVFARLRSLGRRFYKPIRSRKLATKILGPQYKRSRGRIEIDITYSCNLRCLNCNRSCSQAPTGEMMSVGQIEKFIKESVEKGKKWELISIVGGEPTLHPRLMEIIEILLNYKKSYSNNTTIQLVTNGYGEAVNKVLEKIPKGVKILNSSKTDSSGFGFDSFNIAPRDTKLYRKADFKNGCKIMKYCGMGLNPYGYYPCAVAGGIDRVFGFDKGRKKLPDDSDNMEDQLEIFCSLCGHFKEGKPVDGETRSKSWDKAYEKYKNRKPHLKNI